MTLIVLGTHDTCYDTFTINTLTHVHYVEEGIEFIEIQLVT